MSYRESLSICWGFLFFSNSLTIKPLDEIIGHRSNKCIGGIVMAVKKNIDIIVNDEHEFNAVLKVLDTKRKPSEQLKQRVAELNKIKINLFRPVQFGNDCPWI